MDKLTLDRTDPLPTGTFGIIRCGDVPLYTVERPWLENKNNVSCIPTGTYICRWTLSPRLKKFTYEVMGVPKRAGIRIHSANFPEQVLGCIAPGMRAGTIDGRRAVLLSRPAVTILENAMGRMPFILEIK